MSVESDCVYVQRRLKQIRKNLDLSLQGAEELSGGSIKGLTIGTYERGTRQPSLARLSALAEVYGVPLRSLFPPVPQIPTPVDLPALVARLEKERDEAVAALRAEGDNGE